MYQKRSHKEATIVKIEIYVDKHVKKKSSGVNTKKFRTPGLRCKDLESNILLIKSYTNCTETDLTQHSTALKQWRTSLWSVHSCRHDRNTFSASPYQPASDKNPPRIYLKRLKKNNN